MLDDAAPAIERVEAAHQRIDRVFLARALTDLVPNAWIAWRMVDAVIGRLLAEGQPEERIASSAALLLEQLRADIERERELAGESVFMQRVKEGFIEFRLRADRLDYEVPAHLTVEQPERPRVLTREDGSAVGKSLFEPFFEHLLDNVFERDFACYLDGQQALRWWHRNVARSGYALQGWRRNRVYPDFVFARTEKGGRTLMVVMETKGAHLANEDTEYKRRLLASLQSAWADHCDGRLQRAGELELVGRRGDRLMCDLVFDGNWRNDLTQRWFAEGV